MRGPLRLMAALSLVLAWTGATTIQPSWACGCGAMVTRDQKITVNSETSIVRFDQAAASEQIVMRFNVKSAATDAAWLFPTPSAATVQLGDPDWFDQLDSLTEPKEIVHHTWWGPLFRSRHHVYGSTSTVRESPPVALLHEERLGPFQVATLAASDPAALAGWLTAHGYKLSPKLAGALTPYVTQGWKYVAIKLVPRAGGGRLNGVLDPLHVTFKTTTPIYPMRLSRLATTPQYLRLYLLGTHRLDAIGGPAEQVPGDTGTWRVPYADWITPSQVRSPDLRAFLGGRTFMTVRNATLQPGSITDDIHLGYVPDTTYRNTYSVTEVVRFMGIPAGWAIVFGGFFGTAVLTGLVLAVRMRRRSVPAG